jgi:methionyl-tRNA synthetase
MVCQEKKNQRSYLTDFKMNEKFYITTAIDYVNGSPHIGHSLEKIQADVLARYARAKGQRVFFLTGTDEHGTKIQKAAAQNNISPKKLVDANSKEFKALKKVLNLSWDDFIRTTDSKKHWPGVFKIWNEINKSGDIYKRTYRGLYCSGCESFKSDSDLVNGKCPLHDKEPELVEEDNYFFKLSAYSKILKKKIEDKEIEIVPQWRAKEILSLIEKGLEDVSFSRPKEKLAWGIPVPGDDSQVIYVWVDALTNYISAVGYGRDEKEFEEWWPADVQVVGKDILRFHAAIWPAMLLSAKLPLPKRLFVHGFINVEGQKMSKSIGNIISPRELVEKYGVDSVRYYFLREISPFDDGDYSENKFRERHNADLAHGLGNFAARTLGVTERFARPIKNDFKTIDLVLEQRIKTVQKNVDNFLYQFKFNEALAEIWSLISFGDSYVNDKKPWSQELPETEKEKTLFNLLVLLNSVGVLLTPFLPDTSKKITQNISLKGKYVQIKPIPKLFTLLD